MPSGMPSCSDLTTCHGPADTWVMYVAISGVGGKCQERVPPPTYTPPSTSGAMFDTTVHSCGARTVSS